MANSDLPQEILINIFSRLPTKSVGKCRCLDKTWRTLLSTPQFIKSHLVRKPYQQNLILLAPPGSVYSAAAAEGAVSRKFRLQHNFTVVAGSCDGLVLLLDEEDRKVLVNPITRQSKEITGSPLALDKAESFGMCGLGYDGISDDYKIVELSYRKTNGAYAFVDVYSVRNAGWKRVDNSPYYLPIHQLSCGAFVNGAIHWIAFSREEGSRSAIAAFDLADEVFDEMHFPSDADLVTFVFCNLEVLGGCLCLVEAGFNRCNFWVMKEYGVEESWTKFSIQGQCEFDRDIWPLFFDGDDEEVIFMAGRKNVVVYNVKENAFRDMAVDGLPATFRGGGAFVDSLVSPAPLEESL